MRFSSCGLFLLLVGLAAYGVELLPDRDWELARTWNAVGSMARREDGSYLVENTTPQGYLTFNCSFDEYQGLVPGKEYVVRCELERSGPAQEASLFVALPGARRVRKPELRTEFEKTDVVEIAWTAKEGERRLAVYLMLRGVGKTVVRKITLEEAAKEDDLLKRTGVNWRLAEHEGKGASFTRKEGVVTIEKPDESGYAMLLNQLPLAIAKGRKYRLQVKVLRGTEAVRMSMMFNTGKRRPWPSVPAKGDPAEWETLEQSFLAAEDEDHVTVYVVMNGTGTARIREFLMQEVIE